MKGFVQGSQGLHSQHMTGLGCEPGQVDSRVPFHCPINSTAFGCNYNFLSVFFETGTFRNGLAFIVLGFLLPFSIDGQLFSSPSFPGLSAAS